MQKHEEWIQVVAHGVYMHDAFLSNTDTLKEEIESYNNTVFKGNPIWLLKRERREAVYTLALPERYASIVFAVENEEARYQLLARKQISIAGRLDYLAKFQNISLKT
ncbi:hypothetical protein EJ02DRAFT_428714 [Clathrospora elynae]|uniref:Uncharacterized protein n=1 Tax=Clathrospora elynae TaxID=706981 RepID=A0A6A5S4R0_9PLEO|nr:hypothetical protein EJ02DRAFT_428714 [Clathrospora elynae]